MRRPDPRAAALLLLLCLPACTAGGADECTEPDADLVASVMDRSRTDFPAGDTTIVRQELVRAAQLLLPEDLRVADGVAVVAVRTGRYEADPVSPDLPGIEVTNLFLLDADDDVVGPIGKFATDGFDYPAPPPEVGALQDSEPVTTVSTCVSP